MNAIVCNTLLGAVTEYTGYHFDSITPSIGGSSSGLYGLYGDTDAGLPIVAQLRMPSTLRESTLKHSVRMAYLSMRGEGAASFTVFGAAREWQYGFPLRASGQTRCEVGRGIYENYLGFGLSTPEGQDFALDRIEVLTSASTSRRV